MNVNTILNNFPKKRIKLSSEYKKIIEKHFLENRLGATKMTKLSSKMEGWLHKKVAKTLKPNYSTLEIGAGNLNQFFYEDKVGTYDIVEPYHRIYKNSKFLDNVDNFYDDISEIPDSKKYDRIISVAAFEHILDLPKVIKKSIKLMKKNSVLAVSIPNEGRFLWKISYKLTTGREFKKRYGLDYETVMRYEHVNTADEIECLLKYYFKDVKMKIFGFNKDFAFYRCYYCKNPRKNTI
jgi:SAM-dependent methyltransferase